MKPGDRLWIAVRVNDDAEDAIDELVIHDPADINVTHWSRIEEDTPIPDHPALSAVARWLADDPRNSEMLRVIVAAEAKDAEKWGMDRAAGVWRSLIAALTEGQG